MDATSTFDVFNPTKQLNLETATPAVAFSSLSGSSSQNFSGSSDSAFSGEGGSEKLTTEVDPSSLRSSLQGPNAQKNETFVSTLENKPTLEAPKSENLQSKIMQHASMMLKEGGGSMRMDFHAPGMGKIDLAINLANNQLDVRILTPNEQTRDIINKELSGLRDGLGQKGISLRNVEIGNAHQPSQNFAGQNFAQGRNGQQTSYNEMKEYAKTFASNVSPRSVAVPKTSLDDVRRPISSAWVNSNRDLSRIAVRI